MESISPAMKNGFTAPWFDPYAALRPDGYVLLASLLREPPSRSIIEILRKLQWESGIPEKLDDALTALRQACLNCDPAEVQSEYNRLFVGLGSGEIVPYASWYKDKRIQSAPLASLRSDLMKAGIVRQAGHHDSEDHAGALCEIMAILSQRQNGVDLANQAAFFERHIGSWMPRLFDDIRQARSSDFYRHVGCLGRRFLETEHEFLNSAANSPNDQEKGERKDEDEFFKRPADIH
ncbi:MAG: molecular chaperone [Deltaproteobacteria bacterium]|nr:molecular chaperone [Deltaproteobacteria bacterium]